MIKESLTLPVSSDKVYLRGELGPSSDNKTVVVYIKNNLKHDNVWRQKDRFSLLLNMLGDEFVTINNPTIMKYLTEKLDPDNEDVWVAIGERTDDDPLDKWALQVHDESGPKPDWLQHFNDEFIYP